MTTNHFGGITLGDDGKPRTFKDALTAVAEYMDFADRLFMKEAKRRGQTLVLGDAAQRDLRRLAENLPPELDAILIQLMKQPQPAGSADGKS